MSCRFRIRIKNTPYTYFHFFLNEWVSLSARKQYTGKYNLFRYIQFHIQELEKRLIIHPFSHPFIPDLIRIITLGFFSFYLFFIIFSFSYFSQNKTKKMFYVSLMLLNQNKIWNIGRQNSKLLVSSYFKQMMGYFRLGKVECPLKWLEIGGKLL